MRFAYHLVDVFTTTPFEGNPLAVFPDATGLDARTMQALARELNLSETTFIVPGEGKNGATRVRIFTPRAELPFAGHPTIGAAYVIRRLGLVPARARELTLDENIGPVRVRVDEGDDPMLWLTTPPLQELGAVPQAACAAAVSLSESELVAPCEIFSAGNPTLFIAVRDAETVDRAAADPAALARLLRAAAAPVLVFVFAPRASGAYSRMFAPHLGVAEDPATGSATGPLAAFMMKRGLVSRADGTRFVSEQGRAMGRRSFLHVAIHGEGGRDGVEVGGNVRHLAEGAFDVAIHT
jgi:trans-2,3-dihydro-3-hydroxyanthranilate isomerase